MASVTGTVIAIRDGRAWVECASVAEGCGACASGGGCARRYGATRGRLEIPAHLDDRLLRPGDRVQIEADEQRLLGAAVGLYLPPLAGLLAGPALARLAGLDEGLLPSLAALVGLALGAVVARALTGGAARLVVSRPAP